MRLAEIGQVVTVISPVNLADAPSVGDLVSLANYNHATVVYRAGVGLAAQDPVITVQQATDNAGAGLKALNFTDVFEKEAVDIRTVPQFTKKTQASGNTYVSLTGGESQQLIMIEFDAEDLDAAGGFDHIQVDVSDPGATEKLGSVDIVLTEASYPQEPAVGAL